MNARSNWFVLVILLIAGTNRAQEILPEAKRLAHPPGIALVLSGGAAKGFAHIGVLEILDSAHVPIDLIAGTSIGAVIGGLYAAGYTPAQLEHFAEITNWRDVLDLEDEAHRLERTMNQKDADNALLSLRFTGFFDPVIPQAISNGQRLTMLINSMVINAPGGVPRDFLRDMRVPFVAVTTDIVSGERRLLTDGDLTEALRASATLPLRFNPLPQDSAILMDGGLIANIPVDVARSFGAAGVIVSNATARLRGREGLNTPWDVADQVISLMMQRQDAAQLTHADLVITPNISMGLDYSDISAAVEAGRVAARAMLPGILRLLARFADPPERNTLPDDTLLPSVNEMRILSISPNGNSDFGKHLVDTLIAKNLFVTGKPLLRSGTAKPIERAILEAYRNAGFSLVRIDSVVVRPSIARADFFVDQGHIAAIRIRGDPVLNNGEPDAVSSDFILHELPFSKGDVFRASAGDDALRNLTGTGLFDFAMLQITYDTLWPGTEYITRADTSSPPHHVTATSFGPSVLITVQGRAPNVIRLGVLADNEFGAQFSLELASENIRNSGIEASFMGGLGPVSRFANFTIDAPRLLQGFALFEGQVYTGYKDLNVYSLQTVTSDNRLISNVTDVVRESRDLGMLLRAGGQIERLGSVTAEIRHEHQQWFSVRDSTSETGKSDMGSLSMTALRGELVIDSRSDAAYPHRGTFVRGYAETGLKLLGGEASYTKLSAEIQQAIPLSALHTIIPRFQVGFADALLPRLEEFNLGGMESFYGLNEYELRGKQMIEGSLTYQIAIPHVLFFPTFVSVRYDLGSMWPVPEEIKFESLLHGIGAQVGLRTPLGLARFGIGENFRFNQATPHPIDLNKPRFYFSIGSKL